jgi:hypothetical protein
MIDGTVHPNPIVIGMIDFPVNPTKFINLSIINATLFRYPVCSKTDNKKKNKNNTGIKVITKISEPKIPSKKTKKNNLDCVKLDK